MPVFDYITPILSLLSGKETFRVEHYSQIDKVRRAGIPVHYVGEVAFTGGWNFDVDKKHADYTARLLGQKREG